MPGSFMTGYAGFGIADEQQGEFMGKPPWMRQTRVTADGETEFHDTGFPTSFLSIFIGLSMPRNPRKAFSMHRAVWWTVAWLALFAAFTAIQSWYTFQTRDSARMGEWYLHMFGITLAGDWWPIAVLPVLFGPGGVVLWILGGVFNNRPWIVAIANVLVLQFIISALGASIGHFAMFLTFGPHVPGLTDSTTGRAAEQLYVSSSPQTWIPGLITAGIALTLAVIMAAVTGASSARQNGTAMNRLRIIAYVLSCLGFVALLIAICIVLAFLRNKQTNILLAVLAFLTLIAWIPGEMKSIRRCVAEQRDASWQCVAGSFLALDLIFVPMLAATALTSW